ncbi:hypothetical protein D9M72_514430 [compost metagenome]
MPASTSPVPALASAALPVGFSVAGLPSGAAITDPEPFSTTTACHCLASAVAAAMRSRCTSATEVPIRRAASSGCGVITQGARAAASAPAWAGSAASRLSASASSTVGTGAAARACSSRAKCRCAVASVPSPGPITSADIAFSARPSSACSISSGCTGSSSGAGCARKPIWTLPAPRNCAARAPSKGAPVMPWLPPITASEPCVPLLLAWCRRGSAAPNRAGPLASACGGCAGG